MKSFPMFIDVVGRKVVIVGGGEQAAQKARLLLKTEARLTFVADALTDELAHLSETGRAEHRPMNAAADALRGARFGLIATGCAGADAAVAALAKDLGVLVNVVDRPELCDLTTPALVDRDPVVVAIGTEGTAPVLARTLKTRIEELMEPRLGDLAALAGRLRSAVAQKVPRARHRAFWKWVFAGAPRRTHRAGEEPAAASMIAEAIEARGRIAADAGLVSLVGAGPGAADLLTLRAVQRLQEADVIYYDHLVDPRALELARRDAERVYVGKQPGAHHWPQDRINGVIVAAGRAGKRVVRLKCGDPLVFGRAAEEARALEAAGVAWEVVPGVTSALAAAAQAKIFPTERGVSQALTFATASTAAGPDPDRAAAAVRPGATTAMYMSASTAGELAEILLSKNCPPSARVTIVEGAETERARTRRLELGAMRVALAEEPIENPAIVLIERPSDREALGEPADGSEALHGADAA